MKVKLQNAWFVQSNLIEKGEQEIPDALFADLPKTAQVWDGEAWVSRKDLDKVPKVKEPKAEEAKPVKVTV